ncbi:MAG: hypothetical protein KDK71_01235 [Chlamydiia bacterium]|nr:hypothetical protein [Chlamydiia bacterium]
MSLPIVILFERHWDPIPRAVMQELLPGLAEKGYGTLCIEAPQNISSEEIFKRMNWGLQEDSELEQVAKKFLSERNVSLKQELSEISFTPLTALMRQYVSSQCYVKCAEKLKQLPASRMTKENYEEAKKRGITLKGIDIDNSGFDAMTSADLLTRMTIINSLETSRIETFTKHLLTLKNEQSGGIIFACGALHAKRVVEELNKNETAGEVLYYFPHSARRYDESKDDVAKIIKDNQGTLDGHTYCLTQEKVKPFAVKVMSDIAEKATYQKKIEENTSHAQELTKTFNVPFNSYLRSGHHVDALADVSAVTDVGGMQELLRTKGILSGLTIVKDRQYLAVFNVNTKAVADKIRKLDQKI